MLEKKWKHPTISLDDVLESMLESKINVRIKKEKSSFSKRLLSFLSSVTSPLNPIDFSRVTDFGGGCGIIWCRHHNSILLTSWLFRTLYFVFLHSCICEFLSLLTPRPTRRYPIPSNPNQILLLACCTSSISDGILLFKLVCTTKIGLIVCARTFGFTLLLKQYFFIF